MKVFQTQMKHKFAGRNFLKLTIDSGNPRRIRYDIELGKEKANGHIKWTKYNKVRKQLMRHEQEYITNKVQFLILHKATASEGEA